MVLSFTYTVLMGLTVHVFYRKIEGIFRAIEPNNAEHIRIACIIIIISFADFNKKILILE